MIEERFPGALGVRNDGERRFLHELASTGLEVDVGWHTFPWRYDTLIVPGR